MMTQKLIADISNYIGSNYGSWYIGITSDPRKRLFTDHKVDEKGSWIYGEVDTNDLARSVEQYFLDLGCDGGPGGGDYTSKIVYAYLKTYNTSP